MNILSLFDGISIAQQALTNLNILIEKYYASEIDKYAISITQKNFPDTVQVGSVVDLKGEDFKDIDLIIGGSPCQDLSIAKKNREGLKGTRSGLFYEFVRLIKEVKPKYFVLENVNSMPKEAKQVITEVLYNIEPQMINASLVSAQNRKRLFWIGKLDGGKYQRVDIGLPKDEGILLKDILEQEVDEKYYVKLSDRWDTSRLKDSKVGYNPYSNSPVEDKSRALNTVCGSATTKNATTVRLGSLNSGGQGDRIYSQDGKSVNLSANGGGRGAKTGLYDIEEKIRKLTPIECERLQSLPDNYTAKGINEKGEVDISNTQRYKALGNGFNCKVIEHIINNINV